MRGRGCARTYIHDVLVDNVGCPFLFCTISYANLSNVPVTKEKVIQVIASDAVWQILDEEDAVCARRHLCLDLKTDLLSI